MRVTVTPGAGPLSMAVVVPCTQCVFEPVTVTLGLPPCGPDPGLTEVIAAAEGVTVNWNVKSVPPA